MSKICRCFPVSADSHLSLGTMSPLERGAAVSTRGMEPVKPSATAPAARLPRNSLRFGRPDLLMVRSPVKVGWVSLRALESVQRDNRRPEVFLRAANREPLQETPGAAVY